MVQTDAEITRLTEQQSTLDTALKASRESVANQTQKNSALLKGMSPKLRRIARMLRLLAADRAKLGPSDPIRLKSGYLFAGQGFSWDLLQNETYARSQREMIKYELQTTNGPLLAQLAARGVDTERLMELAEEWRVGPEEARGIAIGQGLSWKLASQASDAASASIQKDLTDFLGTDDFATYQAYASGQYLADEVEQRLSYAGTQLTPDQYVNLATAIGKNNDPRGALEGWVNPDVYAAARGILTTEQLATLQLFVVDPRK
ncbi:MAG TPA: hypothetical protein VFE25_00585 [Opitutaceae bacterium]|nr:hypothetical protein [Opitutaceae bacterium]